ncbi:hypothetical protein BH11PSE5_BH11PSE5_24240 [soil metagenome]
MIVMKADGAFLTIGELSTELGLPQHILRYWETRFPQLRPLQRSGNRRYYRPSDVALAREIHRLLNVEGFTVRGAQKALVDVDPNRVAAVAEPTPVRPSSADEAPMPVAALADATLIARLEAIREQLAASLA